MIVTVRDLVHACPSCSLRGRCRRGRGLPPRRLRRDLPLLSPPGGPPLRPDDQQHHEPQQRIDQRRGHLDGPLHLVRADQQAAEQPRRRQRAQRVQPAEQRRHDAGEPVAARDALQQPVMDPQHLDDACQPCKPARQRQRQRLVERHRDARVAGGVGVQPDGPDAVADGGAPEEDVDDDRHREPRSARPRGAASAAATPAGTATTCSGSRSDCARNVPAVTPAGSISGPRSSRFISCRAMTFIITVLRISFTPSRALRTPGTKPQAAPARKPTIRVDGSRSQPGQARKIEGKPRAHHRAQDDLPFGADVDHAGAERDADAQAHQQQRRRLHERLREARQAAEHPGDHRGVGAERVGAQEQQQDRADDQRDHDCEQRQRSACGDVLPVDEIPADRATGGGVCFG